jgi:sugar O-acyltransferase (sialic acid O-acetyltransferase NeuD family)
MAVPIRIPLVNPNEPEVLLTALHVEAGQHLATDDLICTLETTKSTVDLVAETKGYFVEIGYSEGDTLNAGDILGYLANSPDWEPEEIGDVVFKSQDEVSIPDGLRITSPGLASAQEYNLDLGNLPTDILVTESVVRSLIQENLELPTSLPDGDYDNDAILIYGCGGHGKSVLDLLRALNSYEVVGFVDDGVPPGENVMGLPVLGGKVALQGLKDQGVHLAVNAVGGIGNLGIRKEVFNTLIQAGYHFPAVTHPSAIVEPSASLSPGVQTFPLAYVGSEVKVGFGTIVNTGAIVSHECILGDLVNISPGAILAGGVKIGDGALIGMGVTVNLLVTIGSGVRIGNGATVKEDVPTNGIVPAGTIWPKR